MLKKAINRLLDDEEQLDDEDELEELHEELHELEEQLLVEEAAFRVLKLFPAIIWPTRADIYEFIFVILSCSISIFIP